MNINFRSTDSADILTILTFFILYAVQ